MKNTNNTKNQETSNNKQEYSRIFDIPENYHILLLLISMIVFPIYFKFIILNQKLQFLIYPIGILYCVMMALFIVYKNIYNQYHPSGRGYYDQNSSMKFQQMTVAIETAEEEGQIHQCQPMLDDMRIIVVDTHDGLSWHLQIKPEDHFADDWSDFDDNSRPIGYCLYCPTRFWGKTIEEIQEEEVFR